jgi:phospholipase A1
MVKRYVVLLIIICFASGNLHAQIKGTEDPLRNQLDTAHVDLKHPTYFEIDDYDIMINKIINQIDHLPPFGMYKDNYLISGIPIGGDINRYTADVKFQISIRHRLTKTVLPYNTFLMLTYTQKSFWDIYAKSAPFKDSNYNPGLSLIKHVIYRNQLLGIATFAFEHESNGRDNIESRGWNYFTLSGVYLSNLSFSIQAKAWAGWLDKGDKELGGGNADLYKYRGYGLIALNYRSLNDKIWMSAVFNPRTKLGNFNTQLELNIKLNHRSNQYFFIQYYNGYGESLLEYNRHTSMLRAGICIKPPTRNLY